MGVFKIDEVDFRTDPKIPIRDFITNCVTRIDEIKERFVKQSSCGHNNSFSIDYINRCFTEMETEDIVTGMVVSPLTYSYIRGFGRTVWDESSNREIIETGIFGHFWTSNIYVVRKMTDKYMLLIHDYGSNRNRIVMKFNVLPPEREDRKEITMIMEAILRIENKLK